MMRTQDYEFAVEIQGQAIDVIENIARTHGYESNPISHIAIGVILQAIAEEAFDAGVDSTEESDEFTCFRNLN